MFILNENLSTSSLLIDSFPMYSVELLSLFIEAQETIKLIVKV